MGFFLFLFFCGIIVLLLQCSPLNLNFTPWSKGRPVSVRQQLEYLKDAEVVQGDPTAEQSEQTSAAMDKVHVLSVVQGPSLSLQYRELGCS